MFSSLAKSTEASVSASEIQKISNNTQYRNNVCDPGSLSQGPGLMNNLGIEGFVSYEWLRPEDNEILYESVVFTVSRDNNLCIYQAVQQDPFGSLARCGGLGWDLEQGELVAVLEFTQNSDGTLLIQSASGSGSFIRGAVCQVDDSYFPILVCRSPQSPNPQVQGDAIIVFTPAP
jgi:hypothetical protein